MPSLHHAALARSNGPVKRRFLQFSLRGFLIAVTLLTIALGWKVDRARRRERAIQAIVDEYGQVRHDPETDESPGFFPNMWLVPVEIQLQYVTDDLIAHVIAAKPVSRLDIDSLYDIKSLERLNDLNDGCEVVINECASEEQGKAISRLLPKANVRCYVCPVR
jgi:hypothetical protein